MRRRNLDQAPTPVRLQQPPLELIQFLSVLQQHCRAPAQQRPIQTCSGRIERQRRAHQNGLPGVRCVQAPRPLQIVHQPTVLHHDALRRASGSGGVDHVGEILRGDCGVHRRARATRDGVPLCVQVSVCPACASWFVTPLLRQQQLRPRIPQHEFQTLLRVARIQRQIRAARFQNPQQCPPPSPASAPRTDPPPPPGPPPARAGDAPAGSSAAPAPRSSATLLMHHRHRLRRALRLLAEQLVHARLVRIRRRRLRSTPPAAAAAPARSAAAAREPRGPGRATIASSNVAELRCQPLDRRRIKQIRRILECSRKPLADARADAATDRTST